jgi:regulator of protease activity HflC (stomatin/prohibitin superfamily)
VSFSTQFIKNSRLIIAIILAFYLLWLKLSRKPNVRALLHACSIEGSQMEISLGCAAGFVAWFVIRYFVAGFYVIDQNQRALITTFGRADRLGEATTLGLPIAEALAPNERERYCYPQVRVVQPGFYWKWPWQQVHRVSIATETMNMAYDPDEPQANRGGTILEAVTKDQLNIGLDGQIRYGVSEANLYAYLFGVKNPIAHVMGYFVSVLRERIANFEAPPISQVIVAGDNQADTSVNFGVSINDLRKNLRDLNEHMDRECHSSAARYGMVLDASLITGIDPPPEVESALAAINTAHNQVSSDISLAQAAADQKIVQSKRAVEIETLKAQAEIEPLERMATQLESLKQNGSGVLKAYVRNVRMSLFGRSEQAFVEVDS